MSKISFLFLLGILIAILSATGFPSGWKMIFYIILGLAVSITALMLRKDINSLRRALKGKEHTITDSFVQSSHIDTYGKTRKSTEEANIRNIIG